MRVLCRRTTPDDFGRNRWADISIPVLRVEDDSGAVLGLHQGGISIHILRVEDDYNLAETDEIKKISIHVLRAEDDYPWHKGGTANGYFNPRPPCGGRPNREPDECAYFTISIHVLRAEDDSSLPLMVPSTPNFNPRPPCGGRPTKRKPTT